MAPAITIRLDANAPQASPTELRREVHVKMFRLSDAIVDGELSSAAEGKSDTRALYSDLLAGSSSSSSANLQIVRATKLVVPPITGERMSMHEVEIGALEKSGKFGVHITMVATRTKILATERNYSTTGDVVLECPPIEHPPFVFTVLPSVAALNQCKVRLRAPKQEVQARVDAMVASTVVEMEPAPVAASAPALAPALAPASSLAARDREAELLMVRSGEIICVSVLTRDRFLNATSVKARGMVSAKLTLVETDEELRRQKLAAMPKLEALANGFPPATDPESPAPSKVAAGDTWTDMENCHYKGRGVHEAEFLREKAGRYVAAAYLCGDLIPSGVIRSRREGENVEMGLDPLSVIVRHSTVDSHSCRVLEEPQQHVDARMVTSAIERDRLANDHKRRLMAASDIAIAMGSKAPFHDRPACTPERTIGRFRLTANDRFGNRCNREINTWTVRLRAREGWTSPDADKPKTDLPEGLPDGLPDGMPDGEAWVEPREPEAEANDGVYTVYYRGKAGSYMLHIEGEDGEPVAKTPYPVLIIPPAGGPATARVHGKGTRAAIAGDWASFLLRPSEFMGCEPGPCDISKSLFGHLRVAILRRGEEPPAPWTRGFRGGHDDNTKQTAKSTEDTEQSMRQSDATPGHAMPKGSTMAQNKTPLQKSFARKVPERPTGPLMPPDAIIQKYYGDGKRPRAHKSEEAPLTAGDGEKDPFKDEEPPPPVEPGAHLVRFCIKQGGEYDVYIRYGKTELEESPYPVYVSGALISPRHTEIVGLAEQLGEVTAGEEVSGQLLLRDRCLNPISPSPEALQTHTRLTVEPIIPTLCPGGMDESGTPVTIDLHTKAHEMPIIGVELCKTQEEIDMLVPRLGATFSFSLRVAGWYRVTAWVKGEPVGLPHGTYPLLVHPLSPDPENSTYAHMLDLSKPLPAGERIIIVATLRDKFGNVCTNGSHEVRASVRTPGECVHSARAVPFHPKDVPTRGLVVYDRRDGSYEVHFTPMATEKQTLEISMTDGANLVLIGGAPIQYDVAHGIPSPSHCVARGDGTRGGYSMAPASFFVDARDEAGNITAKHHLPLTVTVSPAVHEQKIDIENCGNGRHKVTYMLPMSGKYFLSVMVGLGGSLKPVDRRHVRGSPFHIFIHTSYTERVQGRESPRRTATERALAAAPSPSPSALDSQRGIASPRRQQSARGPGRSPERPFRPLSARGTAANKSSKNANVFASQAGASPRPRSASTPRGVGAGSASTTTDSAH